MTLTTARAAVRRAIAEVTDTLVFAERVEWRAELELLRQVEASLTERLNRRDARHQEARP